MMCRGAAIEPAADRAGRGLRRPREVDSSHRRSKAYDGEVESFTSAESFGVGIRVIRDGRQGFASAGTLRRRRSSSDTLAEARDNATLRRARRVGRPGRARRRGATPSSTCGATTWPRPPPRPRSSWPSSSSAAVRGGDPRIIGVRTAGYGDGLGRGRRGQQHGPRRCGSRGTSCSLSASALARRGRRDPDRRRFRRRPRAGRPRPRRGRGRRRRCAPPACSAPSQRRRRQG